MRSGRAAVLLGVTASALGACATWRTGELEAGWQAEWNDRADAATTRWGNPCGDPEFDPWADGFIADCEPQERISHDECERRVRWLEARIDQCREWKAYLLRNHGQRLRDNDAAEPPTRVE
jgi:hypothetical protein